MHVNLVYNMFEAQKQEETNIEKHFFLNFLYSTNKGKKYMSFEP